MVSVLAKLTEMVFEIDFLVGQVNYFLDDLIVLSSFQSFFHLLHDKTNDD